MHSTYRHGLMEQTLPAPDCAEISMTFHGGNEESSVAERVHKVLALVFVCLDMCLKPMFSRTEKWNPSPIQDYDPYIEGLLQYLQSRRRN
jgi:hypothetical protein